MTELLAKLRQFGLEAVVLRRHGESFAIGGSGGHEFSHGAARIPGSIWQPGRNSPSAHNSSACREGGNGAARIASTHQTHQLINCERHNPEHQMTQHPQSSWGQALGMAAHTHATPPEFVPGSSPGQALEATIDTLDTRALRVTSVL